jgi:hypothetical protein
MVVVEPLRLEAMYPWRMVELVEDESAQLNQCSRTFVNLTCTSSNDLQLAGASCVCA